MDRKNLKVPEPFTPIRRSFDAFKLEDALGNSDAEIFARSGGMRTSYSRVPASPSPELQSQPSSCSSYPSSSPVFGSPSLRRRKGAGRATSAATPTPPGTSAPTPAVGSSKWSWARLSLRTVQAFRTAGLARRNRERETSPGLAEEDDVDESCSVETPFLQRALTGNTSEPSTLRGSASPTVFQRAVQQIVHQVRVINAFRDTLFRRMLPSSQFPDRGDALTPPPPSVRAWQTTTQRILFQLRVVRAFRDGMLRRLLRPSPKPSPPNTPRAPRRRRLWVRAVRHIVFQLRVARAFQDVVLMEREQGRAASSTPPLRALSPNDGDSEGEP